MTLSSLATAPIHSPWDEPLARLLPYVVAQQYAGYDLFDGLNSRLFQRSPFARSRFFRLALLQLCKQSPINLRPLLGVPTGFDAKGGALFLMGLLHLLAMNRPGVTEADAHGLFERIRDKALPRPHGGVGWGYNWDWQARAFFVPKTTPNLVSSIFVGQAMMAYYNAFQVPEALELARGVGRFLVQEMVAFETDDALCFAYVPGQEAQVHNANLLAAAYLTQMASFGEFSHVSETIAKAVRFSLADMNPDGSWPYGTQPFHRWVDNFHTVYNMEALLQIQARYPTLILTEPLEKTLAYYLQNLFTEDGTPKYYDTALYPIDVHLLANVLLFFSQHRTWIAERYPERLAKIEARLAFWMEAFQDPKGYFYYQKHAWGWNRIPYIRWGQAWMFYALSTAARVCRSAEPKAAGYLLK